MNILYIHQYFRTPEAGGKIRSWYIARAMVQAGHSVTMVCAHNEPDYRFAEEGGIQVHYLPVYYANALPYFARSRAFLRFLRLARRKIREIMATTSFDLAYVTSTPLTVGLLALYLKRRYQLPFVFEARDLWPEAPIQVGAISNPAFIKLLEGLEERIYEKASGLVAVSPGIKEGMLKRYPEAQVCLVPNMADCRFFAPEKKDERLEEELQLTDQFVVGYFGAAGMANHLEYLLAAARACLQMPIRFLIAAEGGVLSELKEQALDLPNISWQPYGSKEKVKQYLSVCDAVYVSFGNFPVLETCSPNKFFDGLASGKLMIVNVKGWLRTLVEEHACGFYADPLNPTEFAQTLHGFLQESDRLSEYQKNARKLAEEEFSVQLLTGKVLKVLQEVTADGN